jgi:hypothetical protein
VRRVVITGAVFAVLVPAGLASATAPPDSPPPASSEPAAAASTGSLPASESAAGPATVYDDSGDPVATISVVATEAGWADYQEGDEPDAGNDYVRVTVDVESLITEGTFGIAVDDFILQSNNGFVTTAESVPTAAQAEDDEDITEEAELANGEAVELVLTFEVVSSIGPQSVFFRPDDDRLVDVVDFS